MLKYSAIFNRKVSRQSALGNHTYIELTLIRWLIPTGICTQGMLFSCFLASTNTSEPRRRLIDSLLMCVMKLLRMLMYETLARISLSIDGKFVSARARQYNEPVTSQEHGPQS